MKVRYLVFSAAPGPIQITATVNGVPARVTVPGLIVELVSLDGANSHTLRLRADEISPTEFSAMMAQFPVNGAIEADFLPAS